jgi:hypothetical protein
MTLHQSSNFFSAILVLEASAFLASCAPRPPASALPAKSFGTRSIGVQPTASTPIASTARTTESASAAARSEWTDYHKRDGSQFQLRTGWRGPSLRAR